MSWQAAQLLQLAPYSASHASQALNSHTYHHCSCARTAQTHVSDPLTCFCPPPNDQPNLLAPSPFLSLPATAPPLLPHPASPISSLTIGPVPPLLEPSRCTCTASIWLCSTSVASSCWHFWIFSSVSSQSPPAAAVAAPAPAPACACPDRPPPTLGSCCCCCWGGGVRPESLGVPPRARLILSSSLSDALRLPAFLDLW